MIGSFRGKWAEAMFTGDTPRDFPSDVVKTARRKLRMVSEAVDMEDLQSPPGNRLKKLGGNRTGQYSIRINNQWRVCFEWREGNAFNVEVCDYH